jgi:hypothetical protein
VKTEQIISRAPVDSGEELYTALNGIPQMEAETMDTELPGEVKGDLDGRIHYRGDVEMTAIAGDVTAVRNEASEIYWLTDGEDSYWMDEKGELHEGENHRVEQLHQLGQELLEPEPEEQEFVIAGQQPGLFTSGPLQYIPKPRREKLREKVENSEEIDMTEYAEGLNEDVDETAESMARELNKKLRRKPEYEPRKRNGTLLR